MSNNSLLGNLLSAGVIATNIGNMSNPNRQQNQSSGLIPIYGNELVQETINGAPVTNSDGSPRMVRKIVGYQQPSANIAIIIAVCIFVFIVFIILIASAVRNEYADTCSIWQKATGQCNEYNCSLSQRLANRGKCTENNCSLSQRLANRGKCL